MPNRTLLAAAALLLANATACHKADPPPPSPALTITPATADIAPGSGPFTFAATLTGSTATVSWSVQAGTCASPGSVDPSTGVYTPPATNDVACTLGIRATAGALITDALVNLSVLSASGATLRVTPTSGSVTAGNPTPFTIYVDSSDTVTTPSCALSPSVGTCVEALDPGTHTHAFDVTAPAGLCKTTTAVQATITVGALSGLVAVTVRPSVLVVSGPTTVRAGGATATYAVTALDVTGETVVWSVVPQVGSISAAGVYTPPAEQQAQTLDVVAMIGEARGVLSVSLQPPVTSGTASAGFLELVSAIDAKALECLGSGISAAMRAEANAVAVSLQSSVDSGTLTYSASAQTTCLATIQATTCLEILHGAGGFPCMEAIVAGTVGQGGQCSDPAECSAGFCSFPTGTCPGTCAAPVSLDGSCSADGQCVSGLVCGNSKCSAVNVVADGATCNDVTEVCGATSYCPEFLPHTCTPVGVEGSPCYSPSQCSTPLTCNIVTTTCTAYAARGQPCGTTAGCNFFTDYCTSAGTCGALPVLGDSCDASGWCGGDSWCDTLLAVPTCVALPALGESCAGAPGCAGQAYCDHALTVPVCVAQKTSGSCYYLGQCATGYYCDTVLSNPGSCQPRLAAGATCSAAIWDQCQSSLDCIGGICSVTSCF